MQVFFSFFTFWGHYWLFTLLTGLFPQKRRVLLLLIFFFPPVVFWLSGIRADGLIIDVPVAAAVANLEVAAPCKKKMALIYVILGWLVY